MSIMNTQHSSKQKSEQSSTPRSLISASDNNRQLPTYQNTSLPTSITTNVTASSASSNNTLNTTVITASNTLDSAISDSHLSSGSTGNAATPARELK